MTDDECREFDEVLDKIGFTYNVPAAAFLTKATATRDAEPLEWYEVLLAVPYISLNDLQSYEDWKQGGETQKTTMTYSYSFEDSDLGVNEVIEEEAEAMRVGEWEEDLPEIENAPGIGPNGKPGRLTRVPKYANTSNPPPQ